MQTNYLTELEAHHRNALIYALENQVPTAVLKNLVAALEYIELAQIRQERSTEQSPQPVLPTIAPKPVRPQASINGRVTP